LQHCFGAAELERKQSVQLKKAIEQELARRRKPTPPRAIPGRKAAPDPPRTQNDGVPKRSCCGRRSCSPGDGTRQPAGRVTHQPRECLGRYVA
jgi:hypothetical protein